jgi:methyltransferase, FkbM family
MNISKLESFMKFKGNIALDIKGTIVTLNLSMPHEKRYFLREVFDVKYPQADIDTFIYKNCIRNGDVVLDAGANIGITALEALDAGASEIICVEPEPDLANRLRTINNANISVCELALGAELGHATLYISAKHNQGHTIKEETLSVFPEIFNDQKCKVFVDTIPSLLDNKYCDVWKLDVEGAEIDAIKGARELLSLAPPRIIIAEIYSNNYEDMISLLEDKYKIYRAAILLDGYKLELLAPSSDDLGDKYALTSPMYIFELKNA